MPNKSQLTFPAINALVWSARLKQGIKDPIKSSSIPGLINGTYTGTMKISKTLPKSNPASFVDFE